MLKQCLGIQTDGVLGFFPDHRAMSKGGSFSIFHQHLDVMLQLVKAFLLMLNLFFHFDELIKHQIGIFEVGISQPLEMGKLAPILQPDTVIFTNIGPAHQQYFKNIDEQTTIFV